MATNLSPEERFWTKVHKTRSCWLWTDRLDKTGHGYFVYYGKKMGAYRVAWILTYGPLLPGVTVCHTCANAACVRPSHLSIGTQSDNVRDGNRRAYGSLKLLVRPPLPTQEERFWAKVDKSGECWLWTGAHNKAGYGGMDWNGQRTTTHRIAWEIAHGAIPDGLIVRHLVCDNPPCVRVEHLALGTHADNNHDMMSKNRHNALRGSANPNFGKRQTHCKNGHLLSGDNLLQQKNARRCRLCTKISHLTRWHALPLEEKQRIKALALARHPRTKKGLAQGEGHGLTTLTSLQVLEIRAKAKQLDITFQALAEEYVTTPSTIANIVYRRTWKYLPEAM